MVLSDEKVLNVVRGITFMRTCFSYHHTFFYKFLNCNFSTTKLIGTSSLKSRFCSSLSPSYFNIALLISSSVMNHNRLLRIAEFVMMLKRRAVSETLNSHQILTRVGT